MSAFKFCMLCLGVLAVAYEDGCVVDSQGDCISTGDSAMAVQGHKLIQVGSLTPRKAARTASLEPEDSVVADSQSNCISCSEPQDAFQGSQLLQMRRTLPNERTKDMPVESTEAADTKTSSAVSETAKPTGKTIEDKAARKKNVVQGMLTHLTELHNKGLGMSQQKIKEEFLAEVDKKVAAIEKMLDHLQTEMPEEQEEIEDLRKEVLQIVPLQGSLAQARAIRMMVGGSVAKLRNKLHQEKDAQADKAKMQKDRKGTSEDGKADEAQAQKGIEDSKTDEAETQKDGEEATEDGSKDEAETQGDGKEDGTADEAKMQEAGEEVTEDSTDEAETQGNGEEVAEDTNADEADTQDGGEPAEGVREE